MIITKAVREALRERRKEWAELNGIRVPGSIVFLENLLLLQQEPHDVDEVLSEISGEYARVDMYEEQLKTARRRLDNLPGDVLVQTELARRLSYSAAVSSEYADESKQLIVKTVEIARQKNEWVRFTLSEQAWIGIRINDPSLFNDAIEALIQDVVFEREFEVDSRLYPEIIDEIPTGFCAPDLIDRYRSAIQDARAR